MDKTPELHVCQRQRITWLLVLAWLALASGCGGGDLPKQPARRAQALDIARTAVAESVPAYSNAQLQQEIKSAGLAAPAAVYAWAIERKLSAGQLDALFALEPGTAASYILVQGWAQLPGGATVSGLDVGQPKFELASLRQLIAQAGLWDPSRIYLFAQSVQLSATQLDELYALSPRTAATYIRAQGWSPLEGGASIAGLVIQGTNSAPVARADLVESVPVGQAASLDAGPSFDRDDDPLTYRWTIKSKPAGSRASLASGRSQRPIFAPDVAGMYVLSLVVNDGRTDSAPAQVNLLARATGSQERTVVLRVVGTDLNWGQEYIPGWPSAAPVKDAPGYSLYDVEIGRGADSATSYSAIYKFAGYDSTRVVPTAANREYFLTSRLDRREIKSDGGTSRSAQLRAALTEMVAPILQREGPTRVVVAYSGHGSPQVFFEGMLAFDDARLFLQSVRQAAPGATLILDFSTNCSVGYVDFAARVADIGDVLIASERPVGGFNITAPMTDWLKVQHDNNLHRFWSPDQTLGSALDSIVEARRLNWQINAAGIVATDAEQSLATYQLARMGSLLNLLQRQVGFSPTTTLLDKYSSDIGTFVYSTANPPLTSAFEAFRDRYSSTRNLKPWKVDTQGFSVLSAAWFSGYLSNP